MATGLANRIGLLDAIEMASFRLARMTEPFAVVTMRFPQLDVIDDAEEHLEAVRDIGALLAASIRSVDRVGRLDGSVFVSVLANIPSKDINIVLARTKASLKAVASSAGMHDDVIQPLLMAMSITDPSAHLKADHVLDRCRQQMSDPDLGEIQLW
jgi:GGDEF domain-containing protein